jgi:hypothetical protein
MLNYKKNFLKGKNAQVAQTTFWIFATIAIVVTLTLFILVSISLSTIKDLKLLLNSDVKSDLKGESQILMKKTILAEELNNANKEQIELILKLK